jgi:endonuclease-3 related protein
MNNKLLDIYTILYDHFGPQHWWPGDTPFEVMVGAVLTQNTNWNNVSRAIANLKDDSLLSLSALVELPIEALAEKIRPAGYYNLKAGRLKNLLHCIDDQFEGRVDDFLAQDAEALRRCLLEVKGIGPETADSIILYAAHKLTFVVDAYTHRILFRHNLLAEEDGYYEIQELFHSALPAEVPLYNEYHALLVRLGKEFCKKSNPRCTSCPLEGV